MSVRRSGRPTVKLDLRHVWRAAAPLLILAAVLRTEIAPNDFWWHLRVGEYIWSERTIPAEDLFSFTRRGAPWTYQAWLAEVTWFGVYRAGGTSAVILVHALFITLAYTLVARVQTRRTNVRVATVATLIGAAVGMANWGIRPQTFSFPLFALTLIWLEAYRREELRTVWRLLPLFVLWANVHGAVIFGLALVGAYLLATLVTDLPNRTLSPSSRHLTLITLGGTLALSATPAGFTGMAEYFLGFVRSPVTLQANVEFMPLTLREADGQLFVGATVLFLFLWARYQALLPPAHILILLGFGLGTLWSRRVISWYGFALSFALAEVLHAIPVWRRPLPPGKRWINALLIGALVLLVSLGLPWWRGQVPPLTPERVLTRETPVEAMAFLCTRAAEDARVYQEQGVGSYQIWACPRLPVFIDTRVELYPLSQWEDYFAIGEGRFDWEEVAARYQLTHLFFLKTFQEHGIRAAMASACWERIYEDAIAVIFQRRCPFTPGAGP